MSDRDLDENYNHNINEKVILTEEDIEIHDDEIPLDLRGDQYDGILIYSEVDEAYAILFKDILEKFIVLEDNTRPKICTLNRTEYLQYIQSVFKKWEEAVKRSTYMFMFVTESFALDAWTDFQKDGCLQESIDNPLKRWCIVPVHTSPRLSCTYEIPMGLRSFKGLHIHQILKQKKSLENVNLEELRKDGMCPFFISNVAAMFNSKLDMKRNRINHQRHKLELWKLKEIERRKQRLQEHLCEKECRAALQVEKRRRFNEALEKKKQQKLKQIENMRDDEDVEVDHIEVKTNDGSRTSSKQNIVINIINSTGITLGDYNIQHIKQSDQDAESDEDIIIERIPDSEEQLFEHGETIPKDAMNNSCCDDIRYNDCSEDTFVKTVD